MKSPCVLSDKSDRLILTIAFNDLCITECRKCRILMLASGSFNNTDCITGRSRGPSPNLQFIFFIKFFLKFHTICEIEIRIDFCYKFYLFIFLLIIAFFFSKKKTPFYPSTKKNRSRWVFLVQVWFTYQNEAEVIRKRNSALLFWI